jgi:hypothetical protein
VALLEKEEEEEEKVETCDVPDKRRHLQKLLECRGGSLIPRRLLDWEDMKAGGELISP